MIKFLLIPPPLSSCCTQVEKKHRQFRLIFYKTGAVIAVLLGMFNHALLAQTGSPCNAHRWDKGSHWIETSCGINDAPNAPAPLGIVRCGNSAETESSILPNTTYDPTNFTITPGGCLDPETNLPVSINPPFVGQKISWLNFDVRPFGGLYEFQTLATGSGDIAWALYYSGGFNCTNGTNDLSGDCDQLLGLLFCGTTFTGWAQQPFITPVFNLPTNLYMAVWKLGATDSTNDDFTYSFKARYGCGELCYFSTNGDPVVNCNPDGSYTVVQNVYGNSTTVEVTAMGSSSISTSPSPLTFTTTNTIPNVNQGTVTVTYPAGINYNITMAPVMGLDGYCDPITISGTAPICCTPPTCSINGPDAVCPGATSQHCGPTNLFAYAWAISGDGVINGVSNEQCVSVTASGACNATYTLTLTAGTDPCASTCTKTVTVEDNTPPVLTCPSNTTVACPSIPIFGVPSATDNCQLSVSITSGSDNTVQGNCPGVYSITRTWTAMDGCGNTSTACSQTIAVQDNTPPTISCPVSVTIDCAETPEFGNPTAMDVCDPSPMVVITSSTAPPEGGCMTYSVQRVWYATDACGNSSNTCSQTISVQDNTSPMITCPANVTIDCPATPSFGTPTASDNCDPSPLIVPIFPSPPPPLGCLSYTAVRVWYAEDACGNSSNTCQQAITVQDTASPIITCPFNATVECSQIPNFGVPTASDACDADPVISIVSTSPPPTSGCLEYDAVRIWRATDACGNSNNTCSQTITVVDNTSPTITCVSQVTPISCPGLPVFTAPTATDACDALVEITFADTTLQGNCAGTYSTTRTWKAVDDCGNAAQCSRTITVRDNTPPTITCVSQVTPISCPGLPVFTAPTATDACAALVEITFVDTTLQGNCAGTYNTTRTWKAVDDCGNAAQCSRTITVLDDTPPMITCPVNMTINCPSTPSFGTPTATDECDPSPIIVTIFPSQPITTDCLSRTIIRVWYAVDECGNSSNTCSQAITVQDTVSPTIVCPTNITVECPAIPVFGTPLAQDACDDMPVIEIVSTTQPPTEGCLEYNAVRVWQAIDACENGNNTCAQVITVVDNTPPTITCVTQATPVNCPEIPNFTAPVVSDNCDNLVSVTFLDSTVQGSCVGLYTTTRTWTASDACGNVSFCSRDIVVRDTTPPTIACATQLTPLNCPTVPEFTAPTATDGCDGLVDITFTDSTLQGVCSGSYSIVRTWTASDDCGNAAVCSRTITVRDITPPVIACVPQTTPVNCPALPVFTAPTAMDGCDVSVTITFTDVLSEGNCAGTYTTVRIWAASDDCGNVSSCSRMITVRDITPPVVVCAAQTTPVVCPDVPVFTAPTATDACDASVTLTFSDMIAQGACGGAYSTTRTWTAADDCGNRSTCISTITVEDITPPTINCLGQLAPVNCPAVPSFPSPSAFDDCSQSVTITFADIVSQGHCAGTHSSTRVWMATDDCGNTSSCSRSVTVRDITPPRITCEAQQTPVSCPAAPVFTPPMYSDACDAAVALSYTDDITSGNCLGNYTITRTWVAEDDCGNISTCSNTITVEDITPPTIVCPTQTSPITCPNTPVFAAPTATDACDTQLAISSSDVVAMGGCAGSYSTTRTWTALDDCGNVSSCSSTISVRDITPPAITCPVSLTVSCAVLVPLSDVDLVVAVDACGGSVLRSLLGEEINDKTCDNRFTITRRYAAQDLCGNSSTCTQLIVVYDTTRPVLTCPADITVSCKVPVPPADDALITSYSDNCGGGIEASHLIDFIFARECTKLYSIDRVYVATDLCGNSASCVQVIKTEVLPESISSNRSADVPHPSMEIFRINGTAVQNTPNTDDGSPELIGLPPMLQTLECGVSTTAPFVTAYDKCVQGFTQVYFHEWTTHDPGSCINNYNIFRQWWAISACGDTAVFNSKIKVVDTTPPMFTNVPEDVTGDCLDVLLMHVPTPVDACGESFIRKYRQDIHCIPGQVIVTRTWVAFDYCENAASVVQHSVAIDTVPPRPMDVPADVTIAVGDPLPPLPSPAVWGCDECYLVLEVSVDYQQQVFPDKVLRIWTFCDCAHNCVSDTQVITILIDLPPRFVDLPTAASIGTGVSCTELYDFMDQVKAFDQPGNEVVSVVTSDSIGYDDCGNGYTVYVTFKATDTGGTSVVTTVPILVTDEDCIPVDYCSVGTSDGTQEWVGNVHFGSMSRSSGSASYSDFTDPAVKVVAGETYSVVLTPGFAGVLQDETWVIWLDLNRDGAFDNDDERIDVGTSTGVVSGAVHIPVTSVTGNIRMRIAMVRGDIGGGCGVFSFGEIEDYTLDVRGPTCLPSECVPSYNALVPPWEYIYRVRLGGMINSSAAARYSDFSHLIPTEVERDHSYSLKTYSASKGAYTGNHYWDVYADYNRDGDFSDASELVGTQTVLTNQATFSLNVPASAVPGVTTLRVVLSRNSTSDDCGIVGYGEMEDYSLYIKEVAADSGLLVAPAIDRNSFQGESSVGMDWVLLPNPATDNVVLSYRSAVDQGVTFALMDMTGRRVMVQEAAVTAGLNTVTLKVGSLEAGLYHVLLQSKDGTDQKILIITR